MPIASALRRYVVQLPPGKLVLWCYLLWYLLVACRYFDPTPAIWFNSVGLSAIIGFALLLIVGRPPAGTRTDPWQTFRLFLMPFCVSSFSSLIKGRGFVLVFPPHPQELLEMAATCAGFVLLVLVLAFKRLARKEG